ncbi:MAG: hypothetical protein IJ840_04425 [Bacteroidales bacterium]|nr:hypothetical protein [Bacteroidales bacterium]
MENDIEFVTSDCRHKGSCAGTCPRCEAEVAYLESQLAARKRLGKVVRVVGLSMGLATMAPVLFTSCDPQDGDLETFQLQGDIAVEREMPAPEQLEGDVAIAPGE